jgi:hypothetical protein
MGSNVWFFHTQNSHKAGFSAQLVLTELEQGFRDGFKQDVEHDRFVFQDEGIQLMGQRKYRVEVSDGQQF